MNPRQTKRELKRLIAGFGATMTIKRQGYHLVVLVEKEGIASFNYVTSATPSDRRWRLNVKSDLRKRLIK